MKKSAFLLLSAFVFSAVFFFTSCDKPPITGGNVIEAKDVTSFPPENLEKIDKVKAFIFNQSEFTYQEVASCKFEKNGFTLTLPENVSENFLMSIASQVPPGIKMNPTDAKRSLILIAAIDRSGKQIGYLFFASDNLFKSPHAKLTYTTDFLYFDRNVTIKGNYSYESYNTKYDCSFKKGWNILYYRVKYDNETISIPLLSTSKPSGVNFQWFFLEGIPLDYKNVISPLKIHEQIISTMPPF